MVKIVTDSASDISPRLATEFDIAVVYARVLFGRHGYLADESLETSSFYSQLETTYFHPVSTQAPPLEIYQAFHEIEKQGEDIIYVTLSEEYSQFIVSARIAKKHIHDVKVAIFDCGGMSAFQSLMVIQAATMARAGMSINDILGYLNDLKKQNIMYAVALTTEYLVRGGRISVARGRLGALLKVLPLLEVTEEGTENETVPFGQFNKAIDMIISKLQARFAHDEPVYAIVLHALNPTGAKLLTELVEHYFTVVRLFEAKIGPTIGANVGPGAVGVAMGPVVSFLR